MSYIIYNPYSKWRKGTIPGANERVRFGGPSEPRSTQVASTVAPKGLFDRPSRPKSTRKGLFEELGRPKWLENGSEERFWSILG